MATIVGSQNGAPPRASTNECGNAWAEINKIAVPVLATTDEVVVLEVPAGILLTDLEIRNTDLDTGTTLTGTLGYRSTKAVPALAASPSYFSAAFTQLQGAAGSTGLAFEPIKFDEPVQIVFDPSGASTTAGTVWVKARGIVVGVS